MQPQPLVPKHGRNDPEDEGKERGECGPYHRPRASRKRLHKRDDDAQRPVAGEPGIAHAQPAAGVVMACGAKCTPAASGKCALVHVHASAGRILREAGIARTRVGSRAREHAHGVRATQPAVGRVRTDIDGATRGIHADTNGLIPVAAHACALPGARRHTLERRRTLLRVLARRTRVHSSGAGGTLESRRAHALSPRARPVVRARGIAHRGMHAHNRRHGTLLARERRAVAGIVCNGAVDDRDGRTPAVQVDRVHDPLRYQQLSEVAQRNAAHRRLPVHLRRHEAALSVVSDRRSRGTHRHERLARLLVCQVLHFGRLLHEIRSVADQPYHAGDELHERVRGIAHHGLVNVARHKAAVAADAKVRVVPGARLHDTAVRDDIPVARAVRSVEKPAVRCHEAPLRMCRHRGSLARVRGRAGGAPLAVRGSRDKHLRV
eukprot:Opistho-1_new@99086